MRQGVQYQLTHVPPHSVRRIGETRVKTGGPNDIDSFGGILWEDEIRAQHQETCDLADIHSREMGTRHLASRAPSSCAERKHATDKPG